MKISDLPNSEKPRERLIKYGVSNLSNEDLISIIIRNGIKDQNVKILSNQILSKIKSILSKTTHVPARLQTPSNQHQ